MLTLNAVKNRDIIGYLIVICFYLNSSSTLREICGCKICFHGKKNLALILYFFKFSFLCFYDYKLGEMLRAFCKSESVRSEFTNNFTPPSQISAPIIFNPGL